MTYCTHAIQPDLAFQIVWLARATAGKHDPKHLTEEPQFFFLYQQRENVQMH